MSLIRVSPLGHFQASLTAYYLARMGGFAYMVPRGPEKAPSPCIWRSGLANRSGTSGADGVAPAGVGARALLMDYTGMLMMSLYADRSLLRTCRVASKPTEAS